MIGLLVAIASTAIGCGGNSAGHRTPTPIASATPSLTPARTATLPMPTATATSAARCGDRTGGALITFSNCGQTLTVWSTAPAFIDQAIALLDAGEQLIPIFGRLLDGTDCDAQWSWHADPAEMSFAELAIELCDGCPSHIEDDKSYWLATVRQYCPWSARVVAVDDRRP